MAQVAFSYLDRLRTAISEAAAGYLGEPGSEGGIDMAIGEARLSWPGHLLRALAPKSHELMHYQNPRGSTGLRAAYLAASGEGASGLAPENVLVTSGAKHALWLAFMIAVKPGDVVLLPRPGWPPYSIWARTNGARIEHYDPDAARSGDLIDRIRLRAASVLVVNSPHNPTGEEYSQTQIDAIAEAAAEAGVVVISDEVYRCFAVRGGSFLPHLERDRRRVLVADSLSKSAGAAGLRVGFLVAGGDTIDAALALRSTIDSCPAGIVQAAGETLLSERARDFRERIRARAGYSVRRLAGLLRDSGAEVESFGAIYVWIRTGANDGKIELRGQALAGSPGAGFGMPGYLRLCPVSEDARVMALLDGATPAREA